MQLAAKKAKYISSAVKTYYEQPISLVRGEGMYVYDEAGQQYLDFFGGILTVSVGHCHPTVTQRVVDQVQTLVHTSTLYVTKPAVELAEQLANLTPGRLQKSFFTNSGTEANETAVMLARLYTGRSEIIALRHGYHGRSQLALSMTGHASWRAAGAGAPNVVHTHSAYCYRCPFSLTYPGCDLKCARDLEDVIQTTTSGKPAALIAEPIQGVGGFITPPPDFFRVVTGIVRQYGGLFICDEVQTGWGRTGGHWFGIEHWGVEPDVMTSAKGMAGGLPIGWTIAVPEVADACQTATISTFGGNPVSLAGASATLDVIRDEGLVDRAAAMGHRLRDGLLGLQQKYPCVGDVRGMGLMQGVELVGEGKRPAPALAGRIFEATKQHRLLVGRGGLHGNCLRIAPPLVVRATEIDAAIRILDQAVTAAMGPRTLDEID